MAMIDNDIQVSYFVLCDQVITEAQTSKQSLIGVYSALMAQQLPVLVNVAVAMCLRVTTPQARELVFQVHRAGRRGDFQFAQPALRLERRSAQPENRQFRDPANRPEPAIPPASQTRRLSGGSVRGRRTDCHLPAFRPRAPAATAAANQSGYNLVLKPHFASLTA